jgi:DNA-binding transcriptional LysR family regulator
MSAQVDAAEGSLREVDRALAGTVHLTAGEGFGDALLPVVAEFRALYPQIDLTLTVDTRIYDLERREADLAVRIPRPKDKGYLTSSCSRSARTATRVGSTVLPCSAKLPWMGLEWPPWCRRTHMVCCAFSQRCKRIPFRFG